ncbi:hypothetical protein J6590_020822 [Homalodisca vitripennis]|nr:hypothetical protein J6590_020822 [Homalodisca vitripennis]
MSKRCKEYTLSLPVAELFGSLWTNMTPDFKIQVCDSLDDKYGLSVVGNSPSAHPRPLTRVISETGDKRSSGTGKVRALD